MALTLRQERAIPIILASKSISEAARRCRIDHATIHLWLAKPEFQAALADAQVRVLNATVDRLQHYITRALVTLAKDLDNTDFEKRFRVCEKLLEVGLHGITLADLGRRLSVLERCSNGDKACATAIAPPGAEADTAANGSPNPRSLAGPTQHEPGGTAS